MAAPRHHVVDDPEVWLGVQEASDLLGVSPATLRRWSAAGKVRAFTTPGGHRRFAASTIRQLLGGATGPDPSVHALGESTDRVARLVRERLGAGGAGCFSLSWLPALSAVERGRLSDAGRVMVEGLLAYVDGRSHVECEMAIAPAVEAASVHGRLAAQHKGDLGETLQAFHRLRGLLVEDLSELVCRRGLATPQATRILARVNDGVDRLIGALVEAYAAGLRPDAATRWASREGADGAVEQQ